MTAGSLHQFILFSKGQPSPSTQQGSASSPTSAGLLGVGQKVLSTPDMIAGCHSAA